MMTAKTAERIRRNHAYYTGTVIGRYTYTLDDQGRVIRCKTCDLGRCWIDTGGNQFDSWEPVEVKPA